MRKYIYILFFVAITALVWGCQDYDPADSLGVDDATLSCVTVLEDGRLLVQGTLSVTTFGDVSVESRATAIDNYAVVEKKIVDGWCLIFGLDDDETTYTDGSPLLEKISLTINANGTFFVTLTPYSDMAFLRIVVNLTDREDEILDSAVCWSDCDGATDDTQDLDGDGLKDILLNVPKSADISSAAIGGTAVTVGTFGDYRYQSVGLDGIYDIDYDAYLDTENIVDEVGTAKDDFPYVDKDGNSYTNTNQPNPYDLADAFPMSSVGFVLSGGITSETIATMFDATIYLVRVCSKVDVTVSDSGFQLSEVYLVDCAQESRVRSTVLSTSGTDGNETSSSFDIPVNLGDSINYLPLTYTTPLKSGDTTLPIYIYPNSGGEYDSNDGAVDHDVNPQYIIIKGRAAGYDTDGYYKVALKAQYPLEYNYDDNNEPIFDEVLTWSDLTYDILRNTHFNIDLINVDKPGYKTFDDAYDSNNPATNINYNITIKSSDGRNEILVSNGTYYVELDASRIYAKGYSKFSGSVQFSITPNNADDDYQHPAIYVMADYGVDVTGCSYTTTAISEETGEEELVTTPAQKKEIEDADYADDQDSHVDDYWFKVDSSSYATAVTIDYEATYSGRLRLRIGDILKFIPVRLEEAAVEADEGELIFTNESSTSFAYSDIEADNSKTDYTTTTEEIKKILLNSGFVTKNEDDKEREVRAKIYNNDGFAMLYFNQDYYLNPNSQSSSGENTIDMQTDLDLDASIPAGSDQSDDFVDAIVGVLADNKYTTVYIENLYEDELFSSTGLGDTTNNVFTYIDDDIDALVENKTLPITYTYSLDLTGIERDDNDKIEGKTVFNHLHSGLFYDLNYLESLMLPSSITQIHAGAFEYCDKLMTVVIGSATSVATVESIKANAFRNMVIGATITIYNSDEITDKNNADANTTYTLETVTDTDGNVLYYKYVYTVIKSDLNK